MGRWGESLFEGDVDLDEAYCVSQDAGMELYDHQMNKNHDLGGNGLEVTRKHLNGGVLKRLFNEYSSREGAETQYVQKELRLAFLAALAMRVGATIEPEHMEVLRQSYTKIPVSPKNSLPLLDSGFRGPAKAQFEAALARYKNDGTPFDFDCERCAGPGCGKVVEDLADGQKLRACAKCEEAVYCGKECQTAAWAAHKKACKTPEKRKEKGTRNGMVSLNV